MARKRNPENKGLPSRWRFTRNAYYYQVPPGCESQWNGKKTFKLGNTLADAHREWAKRIEHINTSGTLDGIFDRYALEVIPTKKPITANEYIRMLAKIRPVFGHMNPQDIRPTYVYKYIDKRGAKVAGRREMSLLSHVLTKAVEWGHIDRHPFKGQVRLKGGQTRDRYIEDWEILECLSLGKKHSGDRIEVIQSYIRLKLLTGLRKSDLLGIQLKHLKDDGIHVTISKTGNKVIYEWSPTLRKTIEQAKACRKVDISSHLFCTTRGKSYMNEKTGKPSGFNSLWQRFMKRILEETKIEERFTEHDLRAKVGSDAESTTRAQKLLSHADSKTTDKFYRRKAVIIAPTE